MVVVRTGSHNQKALTTRVADVSTLNMVAVLTVNRQLRVPVIMDVRKRVLKANTVVVQMERRLLAGRTKKAAHVSTRVGDVVWTARPQHLVLATTVVTIVAMQSIFCLEVKTFQE